jgi:hypothetical protein
MRLNPVQQMRLARLLMEKAKVAPLTKKGKYLQGTGDADLPLVIVGLVVKVLGIDLRDDGGVDLLLPSDAGFPAALVDADDVRSACRPTTRAGRRRKSGAPSP